MLNEKDIDYSKSFGIEIEEDALHMVELKESGAGIRVVGYAVKKLDPGIVIRGLVKKHKTLAGIVKRTMRECSPHSITRKKVICAVPENKSFMRIIEMPVMEEEELAEAVKWETEDNIPLPLDKVYYDWRVIGDSQAGKKMKVMLVAAPKEVIDSRLEVFNAAGLLATGFRPDSFALSDCFPCKKESLQEEARAVAIVYFGRDKSIIVVKDKATILFSSSIIFNVTEMIRGLIKGLTAGNQEAATKEGIEGAKKAIREFGFDPTTEAGNKHRELVKGGLSELVREVKGAINYFEEETKERKVELIYLTGAGASLKGLGTWLSEELGRKLEVGQELSGFKIAGNALAMPKDMICDYSIALGCALAILKKRGD